MSDKWIVQTRYGDERLTDESSDAPYSVVLPEGGSYPEDIICEVWGTERDDVATAQSICDAHNASWVADSWALGYMMIHRSGDPLKDKGFSWIKDDPQFGPDWMSVAVVPKRVDSEWITKLRRELLMSKMTHNFTFSRDEVIEMLGGKFSVLEQSMKEEPEQTSAAEWRTKGESDPHGTHYDCERAALTLGNLTDDELANGAFMNYDRKWTYEELINPVPGLYRPIAWMTAVKERIRWLSRALIKEQASTTSCLRVLDDDQVMAIVDQMENGQSGFCKQWGFVQFGQKVSAVTLGIVDE